MKLMFALVDPIARPALTIAGIFFVIVNLLGGLYIIRHWQQLFGRDTRVDGDRPDEANAALLTFLRTEKLVSLRRLLFGIGKAFLPVGLWCSSFRNAIRDRFWLRAKDVTLLHNPLHKGVSYKE